MIDKKLIIYKTNGGLAQLGEHLPCKQGVASSNLAISIRPAKASIVDAGTKSTLKTKHGRKKSQKDKTHRAKKSLR